MKASELITELQKLMAEHGDLEVYSSADYDWLGLPYYDDMEWETDPNDKVPRFWMDGDIDHD